MYDSVIKQGRKGNWWTLVSQAIFALLLLVGWLALLHWSGLYTKAHGWSAIAFFFFFLVCAIITNAVRYRVREPGGTVWLIYMVVAVLMGVGAIFIPVARIFHDHTVFALEAYEIVFFALYWILQTVVNWDESVTRAAPVSG